MDRTKEFHKYLQGATVSITASPTKSRRLNPPSRQMQDFYNHSKEVNMRLEEAIKFVNELDGLVNTDNILNENDPKIQRLINTLGEEFKYIQTQIDALESTPSTNGQAKAVAVTLRRQLKNTMNIFKQSVNKTTERVKATAERRKQNGYVRSASAQYTTSYNVDDEIEIPINQMQQVEMEHLNERASLVRGVEQQTSAILQMFNDLSQIIADSNYNIVRIDENTMEALNNMKEGQSQMEKYAEKVKNNKWFILKIFAVLFVFALIFILIV
ncbi:hypothetical protein TVAG_182300 [Trichomonas vaginalis G3]|uniref:t-SNARE coiled-coil homology domain-containing protein n=1 Tax=Trichomonas vaginalis (strain ATCC PRA-98 / G3) TaxID=412133 RepID=A2D8W8_TRIV3|nr:vesicle docking [Trichomonas vaginalis G3]EAY22994.1 hypothetical protein TVAG_182300 [Trichomonas vaginalis G3]KAI5518956.1 vesicle docking [Trichomonas vaginalis G3]|eukprot:XP_001583980.1 hypothetical protein [Trichomonas vaginalis G3]